MEHQSCYYKVHLFDKRIITVNQTTGEKLTIMYMSIDRPRSVLIGKHPVSMNAISDIEPIDEFNEISIDGNLVKVPIMKEFSEEEEYIHQKYLSIKNDKQKLLK